MIYTSIEKTISNEFWFYSALQSTSQWISHLEAKNQFFRDVDIEINSTFGQFYCRKSVDFLVDISKPKSFHINLLFLKSAEEEKYDLFLSQPENLGVEAHQLTKSIKGQLISLRPDTRYDFFVVSFFSQKLVGKELLLQKPLSYFSKSVYAFQSAYFFSTSIQNRRILEQCKLFYERVVTCLGYLEQKAVLYEDVVVGQVTSYEKLVEIAFKRRIFDSKVFFNHFFLHENPVEKYFRKKYGRSFKQYFSKEKLQYAHQLIVKKKFTLKETAEYLGYKRTSYFLIQLQREFGPDILTKIRSHSKQ